MLRRVYYWCVRSRTESQSDDSAGVELTPPAVSVTETDVSAEVLEGAPRDCSTKLDESEALKSCNIYFSLVPQGHVQFIEHDPDYPKYPRRAPSDSGGAVYDSEESRFVARPPYEPDGSIGIKSFGSGSHGGNTYGPDPNELLPGGIANLRKHWQDHTASTLARGPSLSSNKSQSGIAPNLLLGKQASYPSAEPYQRNGLASIAAAAAAAAAAATPPRAPPNFTKGLFYKSPETASSLIDSEECIKAGDILAEPAATAPSAEDTVAGLPEPVRSPTAALVAAAKESLPSRRVARTASDVAKSQKPADALALLANPIAMPAAAPVSQTPPAAAAAAEVGAKAKLAGAVEARTTATEPATATRPRSSSSTFHLQHLPSADSSPSAQVEQSLSSALYVHPALLTQVIPQGNQNGNATADGSSSTSSTEEVAPVSQAIADNAAKPAKPEAAAELDDKAALGTRDKVSPSPAMPNNAGTVSQPVGTIGILASFPQLAKAAISTAPAADKAKKPVKQEFVVSQAAVKHRSSGGGAPRQAVKVVVPKALMTAPAAAGPAGGAAAAGQDALMPVPAGATAAGLAGDAAVVATAEQGDWVTAVPSPVDGGQELQAQGAAAAATLTAESDAKVGGAAAATAANAPGAVSAAYAGTHKAAGARSSEGGPRQGVKVVIPKAPLMTAPATVVFAVDNGDKVQAAAAETGLSGQEASRRATEQAALMPAPAAAAVSPADKDGQQLAAAASQGEPIATAAQAALITAPAASPVGAAAASAVAPGGKAGGVTSTAARPAAGAQAVDIGVIAGKGVGKGDAFITAKQGVGITTAQLRPAAAAKKDGEGAVTAGIGAGGRAMSADVAVSVLAAAAAAAAASGVVCAEAGITAPAEVATKGGAEVLPSPQQHVLKSAPAAVPGSDKAAGVAGEAVSSSLATSTTVVGSSTSMLTPSMAEPASEQTAPICLGQNLPSSSLAAGEVEAEAAGMEPLHSFLEPDAVEPRIVCSIILQRLGNDLPGMQALSLGDWGEVCNHCKDAVLLW